MLSAFLFALLSPAPAPALEKIELKHFRAADKAAESRYRCHDGGLEPLARHQRTWTEGEGFVDRVTLLRGARELDADGLARVNRLLEGRRILGINASCLEGSVQFMVLTWEPATGRYDAVVVELGRDGAGKVL